MADAAPNIDEVLAEYSKLVAASGRKDMPPEAEVRAEFLKLAAPKQAPQKQGLTGADYGRMAVGAAMPWALPLVAGEVALSKAGKSPLGESRVPENFKEPLKDIARAGAQELVEAGANLMPGVRMATPQLAEMLARGTPEQKRNIATWSRLPGGFGSVVVREAERALTGGREAKPEEDIAETKAEALITTGTQIAGPVLGKAAQVAKSVPAMLGKSKKLLGLGKYFEAAAESAGPEAKKAVASKMYDEALSLAGGEKVSLPNFMEAGREIMQEAAGKTTGGTSPEARKILGSLRKLGATQDEAGKFTGAQVTLQELHNDLKVWGRRTKTWAADPEKKRIADTAYNALKDDLKNAATELGGKPELAKAADLLVDAGQEYKLYKRGQNLRDLLVDSTDAMSLDDAIDPKALARAVGGKNAKKFRKVFGEDEAGYNRFMTGVQAAKYMAQKGKSLLPETFASPKIAEAVKQLFTYRNISKLMDNPEGQATFMKIVNPPRNISAEQTSALIARLGAIAGREDDEPEETEP